VFGDDDPGRRFAELRGGHLLVSADGLGDERCSEPQLRQPGVPAVAAFFGGGAADALARTELMSQITVGRSRRFTIPALDFAGSPVGVDARLAVELGITPQITTGVLHATNGAGQIGAGVAHQPVEPFRAAIVALAHELDLSAVAAGAPASGGA
jgi:hypothetical protein